MYKCIIHSSAKHWTKMEVSWIHVKKMMHKEKGYRQINSMKRNMDYLEQPICQIHPLAEYRVV